MLRFLLSLLCLWCACAPITARAEASYDELVREALVAQEAGDFEAAHAALEQAHQLSPNARTLRGMGMASLRSGHSARGVRELEAALAHAIKPLDAPMRAGVEGLIAHARTRVGVVALRVAPAEARVYVDDASEDAGHRLVLEPGGHALRVVAPGFVEQRLGLEIAGGASQTLRVSLVAVVLDTSPRAQLTPPMAPVPVRVDAPPSPGPTNRLRRASMFALLGLSGASAIAAGAVYWQGNQRVERLDEDCRTSQAMTCTPAQRDRRADELQLDRLAHTSTALVVVSGAAALLSASLLLWERVEKRRRVQVQASAGGVLRLTTSF